MIFPDLRRQFGSIATLHPYAKGPVLTFTTFGGCLSDNVEVPCSSALGRVYDEGWKSWSEVRDEEMMDILRMLGRLGVLYRIRQYRPCYLCEGLTSPTVQVLLFFACCAIVLGGRESKRPIRLSGGYTPWGERYRTIAIHTMALSTFTLMITTVILFFIDHVSVEVTDAQYIGLQLSTSLSVTLMGSIEYPSLNTG